MMENKPTPTCPERRMCAMSDSKNYETALHEYNQQVERVKGAITLSTRDIIDALDCVVWYNGLYRSLVIAKEELQAADKFCYRPYRLRGDGNEQFEILWMLMVILFGEWGTSPRTGWIVNKEAACGFIDALIIENTENPKHPNHDLWLCTHEGDET